MKKALLAATAVVALTAGGAQAQVVELIIGSFDNVVDSTIDDVGARFTGIAVNLEDIDASVVINSGDLAGGSVSFSDLDVDLTLEDTSISGSASSVNNIGTGIAVDYDDLDVRLVGELTTVGATVNASTNSFGDVSTVAAGAINDFTADLEETGASIASSAAAASSSTASDAAFESLTGAGVGALSLALNTADINASVEVNLGSGNNSFNSIGTTGAGAINTANITAVFVGGPGVQN